MRTLALVRHAKSSWDDPWSDDHDRPLAPRGLRDAPRVGRRFAERGAAPQLILSSTAVRARATAEAIDAAVGGPGVRLDARLYGAGPGSILAVLAELDETLERVVLVAHDPGLSLLAERLDRRLAAPIGIVHLPTAAVAEFAWAAASWTRLGDVAPDSGRFETPRELP